MIKVNLGVIHSVLGTETKSFISGGVNLTEKDDKTLQYSNP